MHSKYMQKAQNDIGRTSIDFAIYSQAIVVHDMDFKLP